jgi:hypothetical protein
MPINKNDRHARAAIGEGFDAIPKSVFGTLAYRLADRLCGGNDDRPAAFAMMREELEALGVNGIIPTDQVKRSLKALVG